MDRAQNNIRGINQNVVTNIQGMVIFSCLVIILDFLAYIPHFEKLK
jgi:hypothetical protein